MNLLVTYLIGLVISAMLLGAVLLPLSRRHQGYPADDPSIFIFLAFIWPVIIVAAAIAVGLMISASLGDWVVGKLTHRKAGGAQS